MRMTYPNLVLAMGAVISFTGCASMPRHTPVVVEGVILSVEYKMEGGGSGGFTRLNSPIAVPGGTGSWNVDAYGRLTRDFLIITHPQRPDWGPRVIPVNRLVDIQFGDGGIKTVDESHPASPQ